MNQIRRNVFHSEVEEEDIRANGSTIFYKDVTTKTIKILGDSKFKGKLVTKELNIKGSISMKNCNTEIIESIGRVKAEKIQSTHIKASGYFQTNGIVTTNTFELKGSLNINYLSAKNHIKIVIGPLIEIGPYSKVGSMVSEGKISIKGSKLTIPIFSKKLYVEKVEAETVEIENVEVGLITGENIYVHSNCKVKKIIYKNQLYIHPSSTVVSSENRGDKSC